MRRYFITIGFTAALALACCANRIMADAVVLNDGSRIEGDVKRTDSGWTVTTADGKTVDVAADDVRTIEVGGGKTSDAAAASNLASLRRSVEALSSPAAVLERYRRFLDQNKGTASIEDAKRDMATWQDRLDRGLVKVGTQWVTPAKKSEMAGQANTIARHAADLLKQGRSNESEPLIQQALDADPQNPAALYLRGETQFNEGQTAPSRKSFEGVLVSVPDHGASFNNLGVILWKQNRQMEALRYYEQAMLALQVNKTVLDNISEALNALPEDQRSNPLAVRVAKEFADQDTQLQAIMAQKGLHRWGSAWVDQETLDKLKAAEADVKDKLAKLEDDVKADKARIAEIDSSIDANTRAMTQIESQSFMRDTKGNMYQVPYPATYYTMQNDNEKLTAERAQKVADIQSIIEKGRQIQQSLPVAQYTGVMRLIGVEGTPFPAPVLSTAPATPATAPATPPSMMPLP